MDHAFISFQVNAFGVRRAADIIIERASTSWPLDAEEFFLNSWANLRTDQIVEWLSQPQLEDVSRPHDEIVARLVKELAALATGNSWDVHAVFAPIGRISNPIVRDELVETLRGSLVAETWEQLLPLADGCELFMSLMTEVRGVPRLEPPEGSRHVTEQHLAGDVFDVRRDERQCIERLRVLATDPSSGDYILWRVRELGLLARVATPGMLLTDLLSLYDDETGHDRARIKFRLALAGELSDEPSFQEVTINRALEAAARGVPWAYLWLEIPDALRDDVAIATIGTDKLAPWTLGAIRRRFTGNQFWDAFLTLLEHPEPTWDDYGLFLKARMRWTGQLLAEADGFNEFRVLDAQQTLDHESLPEDADEVFEQRFAAAMRKLHPDYPDQWIAARLATLPLTADRASRIVTMTLPSGEFYRMARCAEIADAAGAFIGSVLRPERLTAETVRAYALLHGNPSTLARWFDELIEENDFWMALTLADHAPSLRDSIRVSHLNKLMPRDDLGALLHHQRERPWLVSEQEVIEAATTREYPDQEWTRLAGVPPYFLPVLEAKAASTQNNELASDLIETLAMLKVPNRRLANIALDRVEQYGANAVRARVIGRLLSSGKLWEDPGRRLLQLSLKQDSMQSASWHANVTRSSSENNPNITSSIHSVFANVIIDAVERALEEADVKYARQLLRGLARLSAPPRLFKRVRALKKLPNADRVEALLDANEGLMARTDDAPAEVRHVGQALFICTGHAVSDDSDDDGDL